MEYTPDAAPARYEKNVSNEVASITKQHNGQPDSLPCTTLGCIPWNSFETNIFLNMVVW